MQAVYDDTIVKIYNCSALELPLPDGSVQCVVTSPPYWGLRKYDGEQNIIWGGNSSCDHKWGEEIIRPNAHSAGETNPGKEGYTKDKNQWSKTARQFCSACGAWRGAFGLEPSIKMYIEHTSLILLELRRVLRPDGVVFWNVGDSYASGKGTCYNPGGGNNSLEGHANLKEHEAYPLDRGNKSTLEAQGLKPKDLCLIPQRVAIAAQDDGWWVRSIIIWSKPNPMPESVTDRPTDSHEYIIMLTKSARYYWDQEAVKEPTNGTAHNRGNGVNPKSKYPSGWESAPGSHHLNKGRYPHRNIRTVWEINTQPYPEAHFATFPEELPQRCILSATPPKSCASCGAPWKRIIEKPLVPHDGDTQCKNADDQGNTKRLASSRQAARERGGEYISEVKTLGWQPTCKCETTETRPALVVDPFGGSGTTGKVAKALGRNAVLADISKEYCELAKKRVGSIPIPMTLGI